MWKKIPIIIPAYEPNENLAAVLRDLRSVGFENLVLVDDGSGEQYRHIFDRTQKEFQCTVLTHEINRGKGRALKTAFDHCLKTFPEAIGCVTADSDGQHTTDGISACAKKLTENPNSLILGCRNFNGGGVPKRSEFGNKFTIAILKFLTGISVSDTQTGLRAIPKQYMEILLRVDGERFEFETNMLIETKRRKIPVVEVPIQTIYIEENKSSHFSPIKDSMKIYKIFGCFLLSLLKKPHP